MAFGLSHIAKNINENAVSHLLKLSLYLKKEQERCEYVQNLKEMFFGES